MNASRATRPQVLYHQHHFRKRAHDQWYLLFSVSDCTDPSLFDVVFLQEPNAGVLDLLRCWNESVYTTDDYILLKPLGENEATLHLPVLGGGVRRPYTAAHDCSGLQA